MSESSGSSSTSSAGASGGESSSQGAQAQGAEAAVAAESTNAQDTQGEQGKGEDEKKPAAEKAEKKEQPPKEGAEPEKKEGEETKEVKPPHKYHEKLTKAFPDRKFEKPEDYDSALDEHLTGLEEYREKGRVANQKLLALFESEPSVGEMIRDMMNGASFREAVARHFSAEDFTAQEGDPDYEGWTKNKTEREEKAKKRREYETTYANNLKAAEKELEAFAAEHKLDEKATDEFLEKMQGVLDDFNNGKITKDTLTLMRRAMTYDKDIKDAREEGRIAGRNEKITAEREKEPEETGDGLPRLGSSPDSPDAGKQRGGYFEGLRDRMKDRGIIGSER
ncbi:MAG TPA: hypothetical protein DIS74_09090 [Bacteroidales bacterium]|nr:hypothetical protein [Bacteroidales bacterium]